MPPNNNNNNNNNNDNKISKDDQNWLDTLAGKIIADSDIDSDIDTDLNLELKEAQLLREALLRRYYEQTLEAQPMQEGHPLLERLTTLGYIKPEEAAPTSLTFFQRFAQRLDSLWNSFFSQPLIPIATACLMMLLHLPLYVSHWQYGDVVEGDISTEPILISKSDNIHYYNDTQSDTTPLKTAAEFAKRLDSMGITATLKPASNGWLLHFQVATELNEERLQQLKQLLEEKKQTLPVMHYPFDVDILFLPLIKDEPIKTYSLLHPVSSPLSIMQKAQQISAQFEALGVKTTIKNNAGQEQTQAQGITLDLQFPHVLSDQLLELMDKYGFEPLLLKPTFRQLRIHIRSG